MYANVVVGNSEKSLVNDAVNEKSEWIKKSSQIFHNMMNMGNDDELFMTNLDQICIFKVI